MSATVEQFLEHFDNPNRSGKDWMVRCPAHDDRKPSLSITEGDDGQVVVWCGAGCTYAAIRDALGLDDADFFDQPRPSPAPARMRARDVVYTYTDEDGTVLFGVKRTPSKDFYQLHPDGNGGWAKGRGGTRLVLYRLPEVRAAVANGRRIFIVEGEKDADALAAAGEVATTSPMGAGKWHLGDYAPSLEGAREVIVVADKDRVGTGAKHAAQVVSSLRDKVEDLRVVEAVHGKDAHDHLVAGFKPDDFVPFTGEVTANADNEGVAALPHLLPVDTPREWPELDAAAYHGIVGEIVAAIEPHSESDPAGLLIATLTFAGAALGSGPHARADGAPHPGRLFAVIVGSTAGGRKGTVVANVRRYIAEADPGFIDLRVRGGFGSGESLVDDVRDANGDDEGSPDKRLLVAEAEFARILKVANRDGSTLSPIIRDAWDGGRLAVRSRTKTSVATDAAIAVFGQITAEELKRHLIELEIASGLGNRFLFFLVRRSKELPEGGSIDDESLGRLGDELRLVLDRGRKITRVERSPAAKILWARMYHEHAVAADARTGLYGALTARGEAQMLRLSVLYAVLDGSRFIEPVHLEAAAAVWEYARASVEWLFGDSMTGDPVADRIFQRVRDRAAAGEGVSATEQSALVGHHVPAKRLEAARDHVAELGLVENRVEKTGGRPRTVTYLTSETSERSERSRVTPAPEGVPSLSALVSLSETPRTIPETSHLDDAAALLRDTFDAEEVKAQP
jgi:hypothetical protein